VVIPTVRPYNNHGKPTPTWTAPAPRQSRHLPRKIKCVRYDSRSVT
jgi:hypothetical protein